MPEKTKAQKAREKTARQTGRMRSSYTVMKKVYQQVTGQMVINYDDFDAWLASLEHAVDYDYEIIPLLA